jgi:hypothetical protein
MFFAHEPADVTEKESPPGVVRIGVRVTKLVVHPMFPAPFVNVVLLKKKKM